MALYPTEEERVREGWGSEGGRETASREDEKLKTLKVARQRARREVKECRREKMEERTRTRRHGEQTKGREKIDSHLVLGNHFVT